MAQELHTRAVWEPQLHVVLPVSRLAEPPKKPVRDPVPDHEPAPEQKEVPR